MIQIQENRRNGETLTSICEWYWGEIKEKLEKYIQYKNLSDISGNKGKCYKFWTAKDNLKNIITSKPEQLISLYKSWCTDFGECQNYQDLFCKYEEIMKKCRKKKNSKNKNKRGRLNPNEKKIKLFYEWHKNAFNYDSTSIFSDDLKYTLAQKLNVKVCPYCNRNYTFTINEEIINDHSGKVKKVKTRPDFDHFFSKSKHPILALSFYNLVPSCSICNRTLKGDIEFSLDIQNGHVHPYVEGFPEEVKFNYDPKSVNDSLGRDDKSVNKLFGIDDTCKIRLDYDKNKFPKVKNNDDVFGLNVIYAEHGDIAAEIIAKFYKTNGRYLEVLATQFNDLNKEELYRIAFANYLNKEDFEKRPMAKLTKDIYDQLASIYSVTN